MVFVSNFLLLNLDPNDKHKVLKVAFFQKERIRFSNLQNKNIPKNYPELEI